jgi:DNA polymerase
MGEGDPDAQVMLIGEAPGRDEVKNKRPFCGKAGRNLDGFLGATSLKREDIYITNVCKFRPAKTSEKGTVSNRTPTKAEIMDAVGFLYLEISAVAPGIIVTLGNIPLRACKNDFSANIGEYHGKLGVSVINGVGYKHFALYHPASIIYNRGLEAVYAEDMALLVNCVQKLKKKA